MDTALLRNLSCQEVIRHFDQSDSAELREAANRMHAMDTEIAQLQFVVDQLALAQEQLYHKQCEVDDLNERLAASQVCLD